MWQCQTCGSNVAETDTYCSECGTMIRKRSCPRCGTPLVPIAESCHKCGADAVETGRFTDARDGQIYRTVKIGNQIWMAENLNYGKMTTNVKMSIGEKWCYDNDEAMCSGGRGGLYSKDVAIESCPPGWHLPTNEEWKVLLDAAGGAEIAGTALNSRCGWKSFWAYNRVANGADVHGFSVIPTGQAFCANSDEQVGFGLNGQSCGFWSNGGSHMMQAVIFEGPKALFTPYVEGHGYCIRCVKDSNED